MTRRKTDGERIADRVFMGRYQDRKGVMFPSELALDIDRLVRRRMAEAWDEVDRLRVELVTRPSAIEQAAPAVMLAVCACVWGSVALVWLR